jgi:hypothetical protein
VKPNVLFVSKSRHDSGRVSEPYNPATTYPGLTRPARLRPRIRNRRHNQLQSVHSSITRHLFCRGTALEAPAILRQPEKTTELQRPTVRQLLPGNFLNTYRRCRSGRRTTPIISRRNFVSHTGGHAYICTQAGQSGANPPSWPLTRHPVTDNGTVWMLRPSSILEMAGAVNDAAAAAVTVNVGLMVSATTTMGHRSQPVRTSRMARQTVRRTIRPLLVPSITSLFNPICNR